MSEDLRLQEFDPRHPGWERSPIERPEQAYRRGFQQGAFAVVKFLEGKTGPALHEALRHYAGITVYDSRYTPHRLRRGQKDQPPLPQDPTVID